MNNIDELNIDALIERVESTHKKYIERKESFNTELKILSDKNKDLESTKESLLAKVDEYTKKQEEFVHTIETLEKESSVKEEKLTDITNKLDEAKSKIETLTNVISEKNKELKTLTDKETAAKTILNNDSAIYKELQNKYNDLQSETDNIIADLKDDLLGKSSKIDELKNNIKESDDKYLDLKNKTLSTIKHLVEDVIEKQEEEINKLNSDKESLSIANRNLSALIKNKDENIELLNKKISELESKLNKRPTISNLDAFIDSTIPVPENTAAAGLRKVKRVSEISEQTLPYKFGRTSKEVMSKVLELVDGLYNGVVLNNEGEYPLNNPLLIQDTIKIDKNTLDITLDRLTSMNYINGKPLLIYKGNLYYATIDKDTLKKYISES